MLLSLGGLKSSSTSLSCSVRRYGKGMSLVTLYASALPRCSVSTRSGRLERTLKTLEGVEEVDGGRGRGWRCDKIGITT